MSLTRQQKILQAIIEDYVSLREPVGSKALVERHKLGVSSATVRNEMVMLEEMGLISAPHSSAGRVPTVQGYRYFVDKITTPRPLSPAEKAAIHRFLDNSANLDEVYAQTVRLLSQLTHQVAILQLPTSQGERVQQFQLISLAEKSVLLIVIDSSGKVHQRTLPLEHVLENLEVLQDQLNHLLSGKPIETVPALVGRFAENTELSRVNERIVNELTELLTAQQPSKLLIAGTPYLAAATEDFSQSIGPILEALEEQVTMLHLLNAMVEEKEIAVRIGEETQTNPLSETAIIASSYGEQQSKNIGVLGPTRMDYTSTMSTVRGVSRYLSKILGS